MKRKTVAQILLFVIGGLLFTFSLNMPVPGFKKLEFIEETSQRQVIEYHWYGKVKSVEPFEGDPKRMLSLFQQQQRIQNIQAGVLLFALMPWVLWWSREKKIYIYASVLVCFLLVSLDIFMVYQYS
ncbi:hypothetical protein H0266_15570 [Halobacillus locisalis]|uniref:Uncharacterized protein n=1 Tax=Halobacillus locisalis TaxID=220753 RepID=A0A838CX18_9BACI|nr:hypothetical protein [Halobacillus locisalis]MBA2176315.1 hypothetical protein [Halobacillus locisalis]